MVLLVLIMFINAAAGTHSVLFEYRATIAGMPVNAIDFLTVLAVPVAFVGSARYVQTERVHPLLPWLLGLWALSIAISAVLGMGNLAHGLPLRTYVTQLRNFMTLPIGILIGYRLLRRPESMRIWPYIQVLCGAATALMVLLFFSDRAQTQQTGEGITRLRTVDYATAHAGIAAGVLLFSVLSGTRMLGNGKALLIAGFCLLGNFATLSRSDWLGALAGLAAVYTVLPREGRALRLLKGAGVLIVLGLLTMGAIQVASSALRMDFGAQMVERVKTLLPGTENTSAGGKKAWFSRSEGVIRELEAWLENPLLGRGIGIQNSGLMERRDDGIGHNSWSDVLVETGPLGLVAAILMVGSCIVVGRRLIRERVSRGSVLMGVIGLVTGAHMLILGMGTGAFNNQRGGLLLSLVCGMTLRARALQQHELAHALGEANSRTSASYGEADEYGDTVPQGNWSTGGYF